MAVDLTSLRTRMYAEIQDTSGMAWPTSALDEGLRQALAEYNLAAGLGVAGYIPVTISGLDGAGATTLPAMVESVIVLGGVAYAAEFRTVNRAGNTSLTGDIGTLNAWADARLDDFKTILAALFPPYARVTGKPSGGATVDNAAAAAAEAARLASLRAGVNPWGKWVDAPTIEYGEGYDRK